MYCQLFLRKEIHCQPYYYVHKENYVIHIMSANSAHTHLCFLTSHTSTKQLSTLCTDNFIVQYFTESISMKKQCISAFCGGIQNCYTLYSTVSSIDNFGQHIKYKKDQKRSNYTVKNTTQKILSQKLKFVLAKLAHLTTE